VTAGLSLTVISPVEHGIVCQTGLGTQKCLSNRITIPQSRNIRAPHRGDRLFMALGPFNSVDDKWQDRRVGTADENSATFTGM
jgi:hypothetical protein